MIKHIPITDTRDDVVNSSMPRSDTESEHSEQSSDDIPMQDEGHVSDLEDTNNTHIPKVSTTTRTGKKKLCKADLEGPAFNLVKAFHKNNVFLQYQMDECHKLLTNKVDLKHPSETKVFHNEDGNPARANIKQALGSYERPHKGVKASANSDIVYFFTSAQDGDPLQDDVRLCLGDDLKKAQDHNQRQVKDESKDHYPKCTRYQMSMS
ncbi:hypothetical protein Tco_0810560 [Tanacetum coccineum]